MTARAERSRDAAPGIAGLLRKDLAVFILRDRLLVALVYLLAHPMVFPSEEAFFWLGICLAVALVLYIPIIEWHQETDRMLSSLPVRRATVVYSRYLSSILATLVAGMAWVSTGILLAPFFGSLLDPGHSMLQIWTTFEGIMGFFSVAVLLLCLFLPLHFRFGLGRAATLFVGLCLGLFAIVSLSVGLVSPGELVRSFLSSLAASVGPGLTLFLVLGGLGAVVAASSGASVKWFERRDL
jgi:hypothetical protein